MSDEFYVAAFVEPGDDEEREIELIDSIAYLDLGMAKSAADEDNRTMRAAGAGPDRDCKVYRLVEVHECDRR